VKPTVTCAAFARSLGVRVDRYLHSHVLQSPLAQAREGIMLHYDDSARDDWALEWFSDPRCTNGYTWVVLDDGTIVELADPMMRTPHAGPCKTRNANSAFYGIAATTNGLVPATPAQLASLVDACAALARHHGWQASEVGDAGALNHRIVGHDEQAVWTSAYTTNRALWGTTGRKVDPTGVRRDGQPIVDIAAVRREVARRG
jgi:N-acetyl-anhydromuramyl-L-alanine amidase AmpD